MEVDKEEREAGCVGEGEAGGGRVVEEAEC